MSQDDPAAHWQVDRADDPRRYVLYLDVAGTRTHIQAIKRQSYELLQVREGAQVLDIGCGTGDDVRALARIVGAAGRAVGVDSSAAMVAEARGRSADFALPTEFHQADCADLPFADGTFDGCRAERLLQHVDDPGRALHEMVRVARPGARIVVVDSDHGMLALDVDDRDLARRVLDVRCDAIRNGWIGRRLPGLMRQAGVEDIAILPTVVCHTTFDLRGDLRRSIDEAEKRGVVSADEARRFWDELEARDRAGRFLLAGVMFTVAGRKP